MKHVKSIDKLSLALLANPTRIKGGNKTETSKSKKKRTWITEDDFLDDDDRQICGTTGHF